MALLRKYKAVGLLITYQVMRADAQQSFAECFSSLYTSFNDLDSLTVIEESWYPAQLCFAQVI